MSARETVWNALIAYYVGTPNPALVADTLLTNLRTEDQHETAAPVEAYDGETDMLRGLVATLRAVAKHGDLSDVQKLLAEHAADDAVARLEAGR